ncbi:MAG: tetratricopeptide repeat protein, partial [Armatimonadota bacterium]
MSRIRPRQDMHLQAGAAARALALFGVLAACGPSLGADIPRLGDAVTALEAPRPMDALEAAKEIGRLDHRSALALDVRGTAELLMYDLKAAQESFDAARRMQPEDSRSYLGLAACAAAEGRWSTAAAAYERALARECRESAIARTSLAFATLAAGDIQGALDHAREARRAGPCGPLADQVTAMAHFALGRAGQAELALRRSTGATAAPIEAVLSPLHVWPPDAAPPTVLAREPRPMLEEYASADAAMAASPAPSEADLDAPVAIMSPAEGAAVSGTIDVHVGGAARDRVSYVVLLLDGKFRAVRNVTPFRLSLDTMTCGDGAHALKVRGYDNRGGVLGNDEVTVFVNNGARRTVDPSAADPRRQVEQRLERCLALRPHPLNGPYLMGRILDQQNRLADALPAFEYVFSIQPMFPGVRRHLIDVYGRLGVLGGADGARVIRRLPPGGRRVALTFDDGPGPAVTPWILDRLDEVGA